MTEHTPPDPRCRICSANDHDALVEDAARAMWDTLATTDPNDEWRPWEEAGSYWHFRMRQFADATIRVLRREG